MNIISEMSEPEIRLVCRLHLMKKRPATHAPSMILKNEVSSEYPTEGHYNAALARLMRTGLIEPMNLQGGVFYQTSPLFEDLERLANIKSF